VGLLPGRAQVAGARGVLTRAGWAAILVCLLAAGCSKSYETSALSTPVILISIDTLRADSVDDTGTPNLARFRDEALSFNGAFSEIPFTLSAHATMLTGLAPDAHGVFGAQDRISAGQVTLAQALGAAGYRTAAVVSSDWLRPEFGFGRGFESYDQVAEGLTFAERVTQVGVQSLDRIVGQRGTPFMFLHYYDAHSDSELKGNRRAYYASPAASDGLAEPCAQGQCAPAEEGSEGSRCATGFLLWANRHASEISQGQRECLRASYRAGVGDFDQAFGDLRGELEERGLWDQALIVVTSDHGEEFGEHGQFIHAQPYVESLAIPLWIKLPGGRRGGEGLDRQAQLADVMPTLLGQLGLTVDREMTGRDLLGGGAIGERLILGQNKYRPELYSAQDVRWKLMHDFVVGRSKLYDLTSDAGETKDVAGDHPETVAALLSALERRRAQLLSLRGHRESQGLGEEGETLTPEAVRRLEALGYVD